MEDNKNFDLILYKDKWDVLEVNPGIVKIVSMRNTLYIDTTTQDILDTTVTEGRMNLHTNPPFMAPPTITIRTTMGKYVLLYKYALNDTSEEAKIGHPSVEEAQEASAKLVVHLSKISEKEKVPLTFLEPPPFFPSMDEVQGLIEIAAKVVKDEDYGDKGHRIMAATAIILYMGARLK